MVPTHGRCCVTHHASFLRPFSHELSAKPSVEVLQSCLVSSYGWGAFVCKVLPYAAVNQPLYQRYFVRCTPPKNTFHCYHHFSLCVLGALSSSTRCPGTSSAMLMFIPLYFILRPVSSGQGADANAVCALSFASNLPASGAPRLCRLC